MKIYTIRHGESYSNTGGTVMSYTDMPLTEKGREQARRAGCAMREALKTDAPMYAFCSDLMRTQQTAEEFLGQIDRKVEPVVTKDITEMHQGDLEGMPWTERLEKYAHVKTDVALSEVEIPGGESFQDVKKRSLHFAEEYLSKLEDDAVVLIFSHGLALRIIINTLLGRPDEDVNRFNWLENTAICELEYDKHAKNGTYQRLNDCSHLGDLGAEDYKDWGVFCKEPY